MSLGSDLGAERAEPIIQRFLEGGTREFHAIRARIARYVARLYNSDPAEREDLVADVILILHRRLSNKNFTGETLADLRNYIFGIARFRVMQIIERRERRKALFEQLSQTELVDRVADLSDAVDAHEILEKICLQIDEDGARLLRLKFELGWSNKEIAEYLNKTPNAVSTALSRCLDKVRELGLVKELLYPFDDKQE